MAGSGVGGGGGRVGAGAGSFLPFSRAAGGPGGTGGGSSGVFTQRYDISAAHRNSATEGVAEKEIPVKASTRAKREKLTLIREYRDMSYV